jgi:hypothetical protein
MKLNFGKDKLRQHTGKCHDQKEHTKAGEIRMGSSYQFDEITTVEHINVNNKSTLFFIVNYSESIKAFLISVIAIRWAKLFF